MNGIKESLQSFIATLHTYDYILFGVSGGLFLLLLLLAIILRGKVFISLVFVFLGFAVLIAGPIYGYHYIHTMLYKSEISELKIKRLEFSEALVIKGKVTNLGKQTYHHCKISSKAYKGADNFLEEIVNPLKPFIRMSIVKTDPLEVNQSLDFKMILEPFTYSNEYNISVKAECL